MLLTSFKRSDCRLCGFTVLCRPAAHWRPSTGLANLTTRSRRSSWFLLDDTPAVLEKKLVDVDVVRVGRTPVPRQTGTG